jgi:RoxA-like, cytochrome c-like
MLRVTPSHDARGGELAAHHVRRFVSQPRTCALILFAAASVAACGDSSGGGAGGQGPEGGGNVAPTTGLEVLHAPDAALVAVGEAAFEDGVLFQGVIPVDAMRHLYISWSNDLGALYQHYTDVDGYWLAFNERYGTVPSPYAAAAYPAGFGLADNGMVGIDCLLCHAGRLEGQTLIGLGNNRLDLRGFVEDLQRLPEAIAALKMQSLPAPYDALVQAIPDTTVPEPYASIEIPTAAAGANDGFGLGLLTSANYGTPPSELRTFAGYQDPPAWWTIRHKERLYTDGSSPADGIYTMMSTLLAFGLSLSELAAYVPTFEAIQHYLCSLEAPTWQQLDLPPIDQALAGDGRAVFTDRCVDCHGSHEGGVFPNLVVPVAEIGTDPLRTDQFGPVEAAWFNSFIPVASYEMEPRDGYLAPALTGIWASAPYLHNGSVPTLAALLDPTQRPLRWRRTGTGLDAEAVGLRFESVSEPSDRDTIEGRKVVDCSIEGMSNTGHDFALSPDEIVALIEYLKTL